MEYGCHQKFLLFPFSGDTLCNALQIVYKNIVPSKWAVGVDGTVVYVRVKLSILTTVVFYFSTVFGFVKWNHSRFSFSLFGRNSIVSFHPNFLFLFLLIATPWHEFVCSLPIRLCLCVWVCVFIYTQQYITNSMNWCIGWTSNEIRAAKYTKTKKTN